MEKMDPPGIEPGISTALKTLIEFNEVFNLIFYEESFCESGVLTTEPRVQNSPERI